VAKLANGRYEPGATTWVKIKNRAYFQAEGREDLFDAGKPRVNGFGGFSDILVVRL
jgi:hypothetical protein